jgi:hypothetical protein
MIKQNSPYIEYTDDLTDDISRRSASSARAVSTFRINIKQSAVYEIGIGLAKAQSLQTRNEDFEPFYALSIRVRLDGTFKHLRYEISSISGH